MRVLNVGDAMERITNALSILTTNVKLHNSRGRTDINKDAEDFYCGLLSIVLGKKLKNLNLLEMNFAAIDLADEEGRLCVQVTSTEGRNKVDRTLEKFFAKELDRQFDRLIVLIIGEKPQYQRDFTTERGFDFDHERDVWDLPKLLLEIERLDTERVEEVDEYLSKRVNTGRQERKYPTLPLRTTLEGDAFIGRAGELAEIDRRFRTERVLFLTGLGGMGKTELAVRYARNYVQAKGHQAYMVLFSKDLRQTLLNNVAPNVPKLDTKGMPEQEILRRTVEALNSSGADSLLILDNADQANLTALRRELSELNLKVLVTTRISGDKNGIRTTRLTREELYRIFDRHGADVPPAERDALIDAVAGHTMTVDMIARTLADEWCDASTEDICAAMKGSEMDEEAYPEIETDHDGDPEQRRIYGHLCALFQLQKLKEEPRQALRCAALLPPDGMHNQLFRKALPEECRKSIQELEKRGWVQSENKLLTIHPVVRLVCRRELKPTVETCQDFLRWFYGQYDLTTYEREKFAQIASLYETASEVLREKEGFCILQAGKLWNVLVEPQRALSCSYRAVKLLERNAPGRNALAVAYSILGNAYDILGDYGKAQEYHLKTLEIQEQIFPPTHPNLASAYNNVGRSYSLLGDHKKALEYMLRALEISERELSPTDLDLANSYSNVGFVYGDMGDYGKELEYQLKCLSICEQVLPPTHPDLATAYNNMGLSYGQLGDHRKALECMLKALEIRERVLPPTHLDLAQSYSNLGVTCGKLGDQREALEYALKALEIQEKVLPPTHPHLAQSYNNLGLICGKLGDHRKALGYARKALEIQERVLPPTHPHLARCYNNMGSFYRKLGASEKALECVHRALEIQGRVFPPTHPELASSYNNMGGIYGELGDHEKSLEYMVKALEIQRQVLPPTHPELADVYRNVGIICSKLGEHERALECWLKVLEIREQVLPPTHPDLVVTYRNVSNSCGELGEYERALEYQLKVLAILEQILPPTHPDLAQTDVVVGTICVALGEYAKALEYYLKALEIKERILPTNHEEVALLCSLVGGTYSQLNDNENALTYQLKALGIWKRILPPTEPDLALFYNNVGNTCFQLGDNQKALEYQLKALAIWEQALPMEHQNNVTCCAAISETYARMGDYVQAVEYMRRAKEGEERSGRLSPELAKYRTLTMILAADAEIQKKGMGTFLPNPFDMMKKLYN